MFLISYFFYLIVAEDSECDETNGGCSDVCVNRTGEITCYCNSGYNLTNDGKTCAGNVSPWLFLKIRNITDSRFLH